MRILLLALLALTGLALARSEEVQLDTPTGTLYGTLELPKGAGPFTITLIHPGSGPTDRNGNSPALPGKNNSLKLLADGLADHGIASLRIDKRGIGESLAAGPSEADLRFDTYVDDAVRWLHFLQDDPRFDTVTVIGHSEGSLIGMLAARQAHADAFISIAGAAKPAADVLRRQLQAQLPPNLMADVDTVLTQLEAGHTVETLPESITSIPAIAQALFRPSVQPYLISWFQYDPAAEITKLDMPVLIVQGTTDLQVPLEAAKTLAAAAPEAELKILDGMNHVLKEAPDDPAQNLATYGNPELPLADDLVGILSDFLQQASD
ncbi:MAG TPA: alpha/beta fold hydrolase [Trueperaceae bacterium]